MATKIKWDEANFKWNDIQLLAEEVLGINVKVL